MGRMPSIIDRYISKLFLAFFAGGLIVFLTLYVTVDFMSNMVRFNAPNQALISYYILFLPGIAYQMLPVACLLATIFTLSTLNKNNELVALFSSGMSLARISLPILLWVMIISGVAFWLNDRLVSVINQRKNYVYYVEIRKQPGLYSTVKTNRIWYRSGNVLFNIKTLQAEKSHAQGLTMYYFNNAWHLIQMLTASDVELKGDTWNLKDGTVTLFANESSVPMTQSFKHKTIIVNEDTKDIQQSSADTDSLSVSELQRFIGHNKEAGLDTLPYEVNYYAKFSFALAAFVMSFIGIPFSVTKQRGGGAALNVGLTVFLAFAYYAAYSSGITLGQHGALPPLLAVWLPNLITLGLSVLLLFRLKR
jgi:lipopolysaccharide export system permease protein